MTNSSDDLGLHDTRKHYVAGHYCYVEPDLEGMRRGGTTRTAKCLCGWVGPQRGTLECACDDALQHEGHARRMKIWAKIVGPVSPIAGDPYRGTLPGDDK